MLQQAFTLPDARQDVFSMVAGLARGECEFGHSCRPARQRKLHSVRMLTGMKAAGQQCAMQHLCCSGAGDAKKEDEDQPASQFVAKDQFLREARQLIMAAEDNIAEVQVALRSG